MTMFNVEMLSLLCFFLVSVVQAQSESPVVDLGYARYQGVYAFNNTRFLGVRYAAPPVGDLRWRKPQNPDPDPDPVGTLQDASALPVGCPAATRGVNAMNPEPRHGLGLGSRASAINDNTALATVSEDCLFLNVFTPGTLDRNNVAHTQALPVVVWIHGGGYIAGSSADFPGDDLIAESGRQVVVVVIQYRLGIFGFLAGQAVRDGPGGALNAGLLDQQFALRWVQKHIAKFGGDPNRTTLWGQSAGAGSVMQHIIANDGRTSPPLFRAAITSSTFFPSQYHYNDPIPEYWYNQLVESVGCIGDATLECLRQVDSTVLQAANVALNKAAFIGTFAFIPVVDGVFITQRPTEAIMQGKVNGEIYMANTNTDEGSPFVNKSDVSIVVSDYIASLFPKLSDENVEAATQIYAAAGLGSPISQVTAIMKEAIFVCATYYLLEAFDGHAYKSQFAIPPATHAADLPYYYPTHATPPYNNTDFTKAFSEAFLAFVTSGDPNDTFEDTITPIWDRYSSKLNGRVEMLYNRTEDNLLPLIESFKSDEGMLERCRFWRSVGAQTGQ